VLKLRNHRFETRTRQRALGGCTDDHMRIFRVAEALLSANWNGEPLRLLGVTVADLRPRASEIQAELFETGERHRKLRAALDRVRDRLGEAILVPAGSLTHRRDLGHVPFGAVSSRRARPSRSPDAAARPRPHDASTPPRSSSHTP